MPAFSRLRLMVALTLISVALGLGPDAWAQEKPRPAEKVAAPAASPETLPRLFSEGADALEKEALELRSRAEAARKAQVQGEKELQETRASLAALKASLAVKNLTLPQAEEALKKHTHDAEKIAGLLEELTKEIESLKQVLAGQKASQDTLKEEVARLKASRHPVARSRQLTQAFQRYQQQSEAYKEAAGPLLAALEKRVEALKSQRQMLQEVQADLKKYVDETWKAELLKRERPISSWENVAELFKTLVGLPGRAWQGLMDLVTSGRLGAFARSHFPQLLGLLVLLLVSVWGVRRLNVTVEPALEAWETQAHSRMMRAFISLAHVVWHSLLPLTMLLWASLACWTLGVLDSPLARIPLLFLAAFAAWRLGSRLTRRIFAGEAAGGLLALDDRTARFYRRSLRIFLIYLCFGLWGLVAIFSVEFPAESRQILRHLYGVGLLAWALWLLRIPYLAKLLPELPGPRWLRNLNMMRLVRGVALLVFGAILLSDLLGFHNLSFYLAQATAATGLAFLLGWLAWLGLDRLFHVLFHPQASWAVQRFPEQEEALHRLHQVTSRLAVVILGLILLGFTLKLWGVEGATLLSALKWLNQGPSIGSLTLTPLNLAVAAGVLYLTVWGSRLARSFLTLRVYPRTGWDVGIQYTISTILHYTVLVIGILTALGILGFAFTNLALVAGALGVGIGFGLQNIVNNFISGLILLFERPIKVGDLLFIDGQYGRVREIRVRSTIFETMDRAVVIIPNSELLGNKIVNWTHYGQRPVRITLKVGVGYDSDVRLVTRLIHQVLKGNSRVTLEPGPQIFFQAFGDSSLDFTIKVFIRSPAPADQNAALHELNTAILETFQAHGINIPFPQRELTVKQWQPGPSPAASGTKT